jgi:hypothetical protein
MLHTLKRIFHRIRLIIGGIRAAIYGLAMVATTWVIALPPTQAEIARLNLPQTATVEADGLRDYRMAKLLLLVANDRIYDLIAKRSGTGATGSDFHLAVQIAANGDAINQNPAPQSGAKFLSARAN